MHWTTSVFLALFAEREESFRICRAAVMTTVASSTAAAATELVLIVAVRPRATPSAHGVSR
jgi:hypothetical protein